MPALTKAMVLLLSLQTSRTAASRAFSCSLSSAATRRSGRAASLGLSKYSRTSLQTFLFLRGGSDDDALSVSHQGKEFSTSSGKEEQKYVTLSEPAPGSRKFRHVYSCCKHLFQRNTFTDTSTTPNSISLCISSALIRRSKTVLRSSSRLPRG